MNYNKISVIIPVKNEEKKIMQCLEAISKQTVKPFEIIVVDGNSRDRTVEIAKNFPIKLFYEKYPTRASACQIGIENATGDYIAFTDADCIPQKDWLENLVKEFNSNLAGVGGGIKNIGENIWEKSIDLAMGTFLGSANSIQGRFFKDKRYVKSISGCNSMYHREDILRVGGFDISLSTAEDTELNRKLSRFGKLLYTPNAIILHNHKRSLNKFGKRMYEYGYGRAKGRLWDLQAIPPILILISFISLIFTRLLFLSMVEVYITILILMGAKFVIEKKDIKYLISIPIIYMVEHGLYTFGFWKGLFHS
jgi:glycosyltransferase involved in cell wall biosynthesis